MRVVRHWKRLPTSSCGCPIPEVIYAAKTTSPLFQGPYISSIYNKTVLLQVLLTEPALPWSVGRRRREAKTRKIKESIKKIPKRRENIYLAVLSVNKLNWRQNTDSGLRFITILSQKLILFSLCIFTPIERIYCLFNTLLKKQPVCQVIF